MKTHEKLMELIKFPRSFSTPRRVYSWRLSRPSLKRKSRRNSGTSEPRGNDGETILNNNHLSTRYVEATFYTVPIANVYRTGTVNECLHFAEVVKNIYVVMGICCLQTQLETILNRIKVLVRSTP